MPQHHPLTITVNDQLTIDAGYWQECVEEDQTPYRLISPPQTAMYRQALSYLEEATKDMKAPAKSRLHFGEVAIATVAVCLRWGSYFAVLAKHDLPQWAAAFDPEASCIGDGEMARINIEASAALADWIDLMQADQQRFRKLVKAAVQLLPFPIAHLDGSTYYNRFRAFSAINSANGRCYLMEAFARDFGSEWLEREKARTLVNPTRAGQWDTQRALAQRLGRRGHPRRKHCSPTATDAAPPHESAGDAADAGNGGAVCANPACSLSCRRQTERGNLAGTGASVRDCLQAPGGLVAE
jgi:hypothetical protein